MRRTPRLWRRSSSAAAITCFTSSKKSKSAACRRNWRCCHSSKAASIRLRCPLHRPPGYGSSSPRPRKNTNLPQNDGFDARRDIIASTTAALDYLQDLHAQFGDWQIALAAYNWGENQVARAIERNRAKGRPLDYANLQLPAETRNYVPRLMAVKQLVMSPTSFRVALPAVPNLRYFTTVASSAKVDLAQAARLADMQIEEFKALNPAYDYEIVRVSATMPLLIPVDRAQGFEQRLDEFMQKEQAAQKHRRAKPVRRERTGDVAYVKEHPIRQD